MRPHAKTCPVAQAVCTCPLPESSEEIQIANDYMVGVQNGRVGILFPPLTMMEPEHALRLAAWLVVCAEPALVGEAETRFEQILRAIKEA